MRAVIYEKYGSTDMLQLRDVAKPEPGDNEVLIRVHAAAVNAEDWRLLKADPFLVRFMYGGVFRPKYKILGEDVAGTVVSVGRNVKQFQPGDDVFADISKWGFGAFAEYAKADEKAFVHKPVNLTFEEAAAVPLAGVAALQGLRDNGQIKPGQKVLINGASGGVGTFAVQIAKAFGTEVTAVCSSGNRDLALSLGADHVIDYKKENFTKEDKLYDLILAVNGYHPISAYKGSLTAKGTYVMAGGESAQLFQALILGPLLCSKKGKKITALSAEPNQKDLQFLKELIETGKIKPVVDRKYQLEETAAAIGYLLQGHPRGKVVISIGPGKG